VVVRAAGPGFVVTGEVAGVAADHVLRLRPANIKPRDQFGAWVQHLVVATARRQGAQLPDRTRLLGRNEPIEIAPEPDAERLLADLVHWYRVGLGRPLPFFPLASLAFAKAAGKGDPDSRLQAARSKWASDPSPEYFSDRDADDPAIALCMRGRDPLLEPEFALLADLLWQPALARMA
jgi:exodeoxyribonuclease V gamma subunit